MAGSGMKEGFDGFKLLAKSIQLEHRLQYFIAFLMISRFNHNHYLTQSQSQKNLNHFTDVSFLFRFCVCVRPT